MLKMFTLSSVIKNIFLLCLMILFTIAKMTLPVDSSMIASTKFFDHFFMNDNRPVMIISYLCWDSDSIKDLHRTFSSLGIEYANIYDQKPIPHRLDREYTMFIQDSQCFNTRRRIQEANSRKLFRFPYRWMTLQSCSGISITCSKSLTVLSDNISNSNIALDYNNYERALTTKKYNSPEDFKPGGDYINEARDGGEYEKVSEKWSKICVYAEDLRESIIYSNQESYLEREPYCMAHYNNNALISLFQNVSILVDSDVIVVKMKSTNEIYLNTIYKLPSSERLLFENRGRWSLSSGYVDERTQRISALRRRNLRLAPFTASFVINDNDTLNHLTDYRNPHIDSVTKSNFHLVTHVMEFMNGSQTFTFVDSWVGNQTSGWGGMVGEMLAGRADLGGTPLFMLTSRLKAVEYIAMTTPTRAAFVFRQPPLSHGANIFALPFQWQVWAATFALFILGVFLLYVTAWWERKQSRDQVDPTQLHAVPGEVVLASLGVFCQQGSPREPKLLSGRQVFFAMLMSLMFLYTAYSANIVALLQSSSDSIRSLEDLLHSGLKLAVEDTVYNRHLFPTETEPIRRSIWEQRIALKGTEPKFMNIDKGVALVRQGLFGFHMETGVGYKVVGDTFLEEEKCDLQEVTFLRVSDPWFAIAKHSPYKEMAKIGTRRAQEAGVCARSRWRVYAARPKCSGARATFAGAALRDCAPAVRALAAGHGLALGLLLAECAYKRFISKRMHRGSHLLLHQDSII